MNDRDLRTAIMNIIAADCASNASNNIERVVSCNAGSTSRNNNRNSANSGVFCYENIDTKSPLNTRPISADISALNPQWSQ